MTKSAGGCGTAGGSIRSRGTTVAIIAAAVAVMILIIGMLYIMKVGPFKKDIDADMDLDESDIRRDGPSTLPKHPATSPKHSETLPKHPETLPKHPATSAKHSETLPKTPETLPKHPAKPIIPTFVMVLNRTLTNPRLNYTHKVDKHLGKIRLVTTFADGHKRRITLKNVNSKLRSFGASLKLNGKNYILVVQTVKGNNVNLTFFGPSGKPSTTSWFVK